MSSEDEFGFGQYPDLLDAMPGLEGELFPQRSETADEDGKIELAFLPLRDIVLFPQMVMPLFVGRERSLAAVKAAIANNENMVVAAQRDTSVTEPGISDLFNLGTEITIGKALKMPDNSTSVLAQGRRRVEIIQFTQWDPYIRVRARVIYESLEWDRNTEALMRAVLTLFEKTVMLNRNMPEDAYTFAINIDEPGWLADFVASTLNIPIDMRQDVLETFNPGERLQKVSMLLAKELEVLELEDQIHSRVQQEMDRSQREHFLREQMRVIQGELGEADLFTQEIAEVRELAAAKELPEAARAKVDKEVARLGAMPPMSPEVGIIRTYIDWILSLPWLETSEDNLDVAHAAEGLDNDHYGLEKVKDRILEFIAVKKIASDKMRSPILCFVGPPGTGKTSIGRSIADALGREFVRISLGGVRDEAEIRGHRRTYIGAMPGRIIQAMKRAGTRNPLFMLDEIDKLGNDFRGDPSSALLEVLDPEQNYSFADHYLDVDYDLSKILFVTTANYLDTIPPALRDRMEIIEFSGYMLEEKLGICRQFLVQQQLGAHGLDDLDIDFTDGAIQAIIQQYTQEAGVRNLEREVANVCRKIARDVAEKRPFPTQITAKEVENLLGAPRFSPEMLQDEDQVGIATGAAWTAVGGDIMFIEVNLMPGKGNLTLTGQLGDVMQESARAALTYTRSQATALGIDSGRFEKTDIHIHVPEGAVPKDGPSAGVSLATALISAFTKRPVYRNVSMTGETTLRGRVLPVGGIREKALAARRAGITKFILPKKNERDLDDIPEQLRKDIEFVLVEKVNEVVAAAMHPTKPKIRKRPSRKQPPLTPPAGAPPS